MNKRTIIIIIAVVLVLIIGLVSSYYLVVMPSRRYSTACSYFDNGDYESAESIFLELGNYKDSQAQAELSNKNIRYNQAVEALSNEDYENAESLFSSLQGFKDSSFNAALARTSKIYRNAGIALANGDYQTAIEYYGSISGYSDSDLCQRNAYYLLGKEYLDTKQNELAVSAFEMSEHYNDADSLIFQAAVNLLDAKKYERAKEIFSSLNTPEATLHFYYAKGKQEMKDGDYEKAIVSFGRADETKDAAQLQLDCKFLIAEGFWKKGYLSTAKKKYSELPDDYVYTANYKSIPVADRLSSLEKFKGFVAMCGKWKCSSMHASVKQVSKSYGSWTGWEDDRGDYYLEVTCIINDDNTVTLNAKADVWSYSNYSSVGEYVRSSEFQQSYQYTGTSVPYKIEYDGIETLLSSVDYSGSLTYSNKTFKIRIDKVKSNEDVYFNYVYCTYGTYSELVVEY